VPLERLPGSLVDVYYPEGGLGAAELFQAEAEALYRQLAADLGFEIDIAPSEVLTGSEAISGTGEISSTVAATTTNTLSNTAPADLAPVALKLYRSEFAFRQSVFLSFPLVDWLSAWTAPDEAVKLAVGGNLNAITMITNTAGIDPYRPALAASLTRSILYEMGVETEWLVKGMAAYEATRLAGVSPAGDLRGVKRECG
jgi:hypothetical protein